MSKIQVRRPHNLSKEDCQSLSRELLDKLVEKFGGNYRADGPNYAYRHTAGVNAIVEPGPDELVVNVKLGMMARAFAPQLETEMNKVLDQYLT